MNLDHEVEKARNLLRRAGQDGHAERIRAVLPWRRIYQDLRGQGPSITGIFYNGAWGKLARWLGLPSGTTLQTDVGEEGQDGRSILFSAVTVLGKSPDEDVRYLDLHWRNEADVLPSLREVAAWFLANRARFRTYGWLVKRVWGPVAKFMEGP